jgi:hypothetical protein
VWQRIFGTKLRLESERVRQDFEKGKQEEIERLKENEEETELSV